MTIYEALKKNKMAFGLMETPEFTNEEMQAKAEEIGIRVMSLYTTNIDGKYEFLHWCAREHGDFRTNETYHLPDHYQEDKYELCEIFEDENSDGDLTYIHYESEHPCTIGSAVGINNFAGFLYDDDEMRPASVRYFNENGVELFDNMPIKRIQSGKIIVKRPYPNGNVAFLKESNNG